MTSLASQVVLPVYLYLCTSLKALGRSLLEFTACDVTCTIQLGQYELFVSNALRTPPSNTAKCPTNEVHGHFIRVLRFSSPNAPTHRPVRGDTRCQGFHCSSLHGGTGKRNRGLLVNVPPRAMMSCWLSTHVMQLFGLRSSELNHDSQR